MLAVSPPAFDFAAPRASDPAWTTAPAKGSRRSLSCGPPSG